MKNTNLIIGKTHTGKTKMLFESFESAIEKNENIVVFDEKEEYFKTYKKELDEKGYNTYVINLKDATKSNGYNPLELPYRYYKSGNIDKSIDLIQTIAHELCCSDTNADPFWENCASDYITGLCLIMFKEAKEEEINIGSIQTLVTLSETLVDGTSAIKKYFNNVSVLDPSYIYTSTTVMAPSDTRGSILSVVKEKLNNYCAKPNLLNLLCDSELKLTEINDKTAIFIMGNESKMSNILIDQLISQQLSFNYILDNFDNNILKLQDLIKNIDYYNSKLMVAVRSESDLINNYGKNIKEKFENVVSLTEEKEYKIINNEASYPTHELKEVKYFNIVEFLKNI